MFGLLSVLFFGISDEIRIRKDIKNDLFIFRQIIYLKNIQKYCMKSIELIQ